jgi:predicted aspartyl protease
MVYLDADKSRISASCDVIQVGLYEAAVRIGGQPFNLQVDTGSADLVIVTRHCAPCNVCRC